MKLHIVSDGRSTFGTRVITPSGDEIIARNVRFSANPNEEPVLILELIGVSIEAEAILLVAPK